MRVRRSSWRRGVCVVTLVSVTGCASAPPARSFAELPRRIDVGTRVTVIAKDGVAATGKVETLHAQSLALVTDQARREFPAERVERVTRKKGNPGKGAVIGLGVGIAVGLLVAGSSGSGDGFDGYDQLALLLLMPLGTAAGAVVGALVKTDRTVYLAPAAPQP